MKKLITAMLILTCLLFSALFVSCTYETEPADLCYHEWVLSSAAIEATCEVDGRAAEYVCERCGKIKGGESVNALGHNYEQEINPPTCVDDGYIVYTCTRCKSGYQEKNADATGIHIWDKQSCADNRECIVCHAVEEAKAHDYAVTEVPATCIADGYTEYSCTRCSSSYQVKTTDATGVHTWDKELSCTEGHECTVCGAVETALGHDYQTTVIPATCTTDGYTLHKCSRCDDAYNTDETEAIGHTPDGGWGDGEKALKENETCVYITTYTATCSNCGQTIYKNEETTEHKSITVITTSATCEEQGYKREKCSLCDEWLGEAVAYTDAGAHSWDNGVLDEKGITTYTCTLCQATKTVVTAEGKSATVSKENLSGNGVELKGSDVTIAMDSATVEGLGEQVEKVELSAETLSEEQVESLEIDAELKERIGDKPIYNFTAKSGEDSLTNFGGKVTVTVPYELGENEDVDSLVVWYINDNGEIEEIEATYSNGYATFETTHFSYYTVTKMTPAERCEKYGHSDKVIVVDATCTEGGYTLTICMRCGRVEKTNEVDALGHDYELIAEQAATCTAAGYKSYKCSRCNKTRTESTDSALGHVFSVAEHKDATCTEFGYDINKCANCDASYKTTIAKIAHDYELEEKAPTCVEAGYKKYTCKVCEDSYQIDILPTGIHNYKNGECVVCGKADPSWQEEEEGAFFTEGLVSLLDKGELVVAIPDVTVGGIPMGSDGFMTITVDELYLKVSKDEISGYGKFDFNSGNAPIATTGGGWIFIEGGKVYVAYDSTSYSGYSSSSTGSIDKTTAYSGGYAVLPLEEAFLSILSSTGANVTIPVDEILPMIPTYAEWIDGEVLPLAKIALLSCSDIIEKYVGGLVNALFERRDTEFGYTFVLSGEKVAVLVDALANNTVAEVIDIIFGEGTFEELTDKISSIADLTVGDVLRAIDASDVTMDDIISAVDVLANELWGVESLDAFLTAMAGEEMITKEILYSEEIAGMRVLDIVTMFAGSMGEGNANGQGGFDAAAMTKEAIAQTIQMVGSMRLIPESEKEMATAIGDMARYVLSDIVILSVATDKDGKILYGELGITVDEDGINFISNFVPEYVQSSIATIRVGMTITFGKEQVPEFDYESAMAEYAGFADNYELTKEILISAGVDEEDIVVGEDGKVISFKAETVESIRKIDEKEIYWYTERIMNEEKFMEFYNQSYKLFGDDKTATVAYELRNVKIGEYTVAGEGVVTTKDCGAWLQVRPNVTGKTTNKGILVITIENGAGEKLVGEFDLEENGHSSGTFSFCYYYNTQTGEAEAYSYLGQNGKHELEATQEGNVEPVGCEGFGEEHFICKNCGKEFIRYFTNGHKNTEKTYEFATEEQDCEKGVTVTVTCKDCKKVVEQYITYGHSIESSGIDLSELGMCGGYVKIETCNMCGKVLYSDVGDYACKWEYVTTSADGVELYRCVKCGTEKYEFGFEGEKDENCRIEHTYRIKYVKDGKEIYAFENTYYEAAHDYELLSYELKGNYCYDGVLYIYKCKDCGEEHNEYNYDHYVYFNGNHTLAVELESIDLAEYGCVCGGTFRVATCPCGQEKSYYFDCDCNFERIGVELWAEDACEDTGYDAYEYICCVTDPECGFKFRTARYWKKLADECTVYECEVVEVYDKLNETWVNVYLRYTGATMQNHSFVHHDDEYEEDGLTVNVSEDLCPICKSSEINAVYHDAEHVVVKSDYIRVDTIEGSVYQRIECYVYYDGRQYESQTKVIERRRDDDYEYWSQRDYEYHFEEGCVCTVTYTDSNGTNDVYKDSCHKTELIAVKDATCTQPGREEWRCEVCGYVENSYETEPRCHDWRFVGDGYVCLICGLQNANGASGDVVMEDLTEQYGGDQYYVVGIYNRDKEGYVKYNPTVIIVLHEAPEDGNDEIILSVRAEQVYGEFNGYRISKADVVRVAEELGYEVGEYDVRFALVPYGGDYYYDTAITFTEDKEQQFITSAGMYKTGLVSGEEGYYFMFTPDASGYWEIFSVCEKDTYGDLFMEGVEDSLCSNDDDAGNQQFLLGYDLTEGTTYLVKVKYCSDNVEGQFRVYFHYVG